MGKVKKTVIIGIYKTLNNSFFGSANFQVETLSRGETIIKITFLPFPEFSIVLKYVPDIYKMVLTPGRVEQNEEKTFGPDRFDVFYNYLKNWSGYVHTELQVLSFNLKEFGNIRQKLEEQINKRFKNQDKPFTKEESVNWEKRIDEFCKNLEKLHKEHEITKNELKKIKEEFKTLKEDLRLFPSGIWLRTACNKILSLAKSFPTSKTGQKLLTHTVQKLIEKHIDS